MLHFVIAMLRVSMAAAALLTVSVLDVRAQDATRPEDTGPVGKDLVFGEPDEMTAGTNVYLDDVIVRGKSGNLLRVGQGRRSIFVAPIDPSVIGFLPIGSIIDVRGTLRETPSAEQAELTYGTSDRAAERLARDRLYVDAWDVSSLP